MNTDRTCLNQHLPRLSCYVSGALQIPSKKISGSFKVNLLKKFNRKKEIKEHHQQQIV